jgi:hypothetical protein
MRKLVILLLIWSSLSGSSYGQDLFEKSYDVDINSGKSYITNLIQVPDSGFVFSSVKYQDLNNSILLGRMNKYGDVQWVRQFDEPYTLTQANFDISPTGFIYMTFSAYQEDPGEYYPVMVKLDLAGNLIWSKAYSANVPRFVNSEQLFVGNDCIYLAGEVMSTIPSDLFLMKTDTIGNPMWGITYNTEGTDFLRDAALLSNGDILLSGRSEDAQFNNYGCLVRIAPDGSSVWKKRFHTPLYNLIDMQAIAEDPNGSIVLSGYADSTSNELGFGLWDMCLMKVSSTGDFVWGKIYGGESYDEFWEVIPTDDGGYVLAAEPESFGGVSRIGLMKVDAEGEQEWLNLYGESSGGFPNNAIETSDNNFAILAMNGNYDQFASMLMLKVDEYGNSLCRQTAVTLPDQSIECAWEDFGTLGSFEGEGSYNPEVTNYPLNASDLCVPSNIDLRISEDEFQVYPNPARNSITLKFHGAAPDAEITYTIRDTRGRILFSSKSRASGGSFSRAIDLTQFSSGFYVVELTANDRRFRQKFIKQ